MTYRKRKSIRTAILALATAAILVPAAQAYPSVGPHMMPTYDTYSPQALKALNQRYEKMGEAYLLKSSGYSPQALKALGEMWQAKAAAFQATRPDDRGGIKGVGPTTTITSDYVDRQVANLEAKSSAVTHVDDRAGVRGPGPVETPALVSTHDGFDWTDAGIGGAAMLFVAALIAAALMARRRPSIAV
jgi:hypothetical protein